MVSSPRPRWFQLNALNLVSKAQALADVPYMGPVLGVSKTSISGFVAVGPHCIYIYIYIYSFFVYVYLYICKYIYIFIFVLYIHVFIYVFLFVYIKMFIFIFIFL